METAKNKVLAFDLGNVLFGFDYTIALKKIKSRMKASVEDVIKALYVDDFGLDFERGLVSGPQFYGQFKERFSATLSYETFVDIWCKIFFPLPEVISLVASFKPKYSLYLISNLNRLHFEYLYGKYGAVFCLFDDLILSFKLKSVKPERKIYDALRRAAGVDFSEIVYIDDRPDLISAAKQFNLKCIQFKSYRQLVADLQSLGVAAEN